MPGLIQQKLAGCIKWLPPKHEISPYEPDLEEEGCDHPVVVLSSRAVNGRVEFLILTSFGDTDLKDKYPRNRDARLDHLPISPSKAHPDNQTLLFLDTKSADLKKNSYVKIKKRFSIFLASLRPYDRNGQQVFLHKMSYKTLVKHVGFTESPSAPPPASSSWDEDAMPSLLDQPGPQTINPYHGRSYRSTPAVGSTPIRHSTRMLESSDDDIPQVVPIYETDRSVNPVRPLARHSVAQEYGTLPSYTNPRPKREPPNCCATLVVLLGIGLMVYFLVRWSN